MQYGIKTISLFLTITYCAPVENQTLQIKVVQSSPSIADLLIISKTVLIVSGLYFSAKLEIKNFLLILIKRKTSREAVKIKIKCLFLHNFGIQVDPILYYLKLHSKTKYVNATFGACSCYQLIVNIFTPIVVKQNFSSVTLILKKPLLGWEIKKIDRKTK